MRTHSSLTGLSAAVMLFVVGVAMHEAARDHLTVPDVTRIAEGPVAPHVE
jgi:hypothetical protein